MATSPTCGGFCQYLLCVTGVAFLVAGTCNLPRHQETERLEARRRQLQAELNQLDDRHWQLRRYEDALLHDSFFRDGVLRRVYPARLKNEFTLEEWLRLQKTGEGRERVQVSF